MSRSKWKNPYIKYSNKQNVTKKVQIISRNYEITPNIVGKYFKIHTGKEFVKINIVDEMIGHKLGEFASTRAKFVFKKNKKTNKHK